MTGKCGHEIDFPFTPTNVVCKACFEAQGFQYNRNSYTDLERSRQGSARSGMGTPLRGVEPPDVRKAQIAAILNPVLQLPGRPRHVNHPDLARARSDALALVKERFGIGRTTALMYAKEFRTAA